MPTNPTTAAYPNPLEPPGQGVKFDSAQWGDWFYKIYESILKDGAVFPKLTIQGKALKKRSITNEQLDSDELITVECGWYSNYTSDSGNTIFGFAANVRRSTGVTPAVGGQFSAYANSGVINAPIFGVIGAAIGELLSDSPLTASEADIGIKTSSSIRKKIGFNAYFTNYSAKDGLGSNYYNYHTVGQLLDSDARSAAGEFCGWNIGYDFSPTSLDTSNVPAWSAVARYIYGDIISSGGVLWKCIATSLNNVPPNAAFWVQRSVAVGYGTNNYAVGMDFTSLTPAALLRIWSGIRFPAFLPFHWDSLGTIGTFYDGTNGRHVLSSTFVGGATVRWLEVDTITGVLWYGGNLQAPGGGGAAALGTIGGTGPTVAAMFKWMPWHDNIGNPIWIPTWK